MWGAFATFTSHNFSSPSLYLYSIYFFVHGQISLYPSSLIAMKKTVVNRYQDETWLSCNCPVDRSIRPECWYEALCVTRLAGEEEVSGVVSVTPLFISRCLYPRLHVSPGPHLSHPQVFSLKRTIVGHCFCSGAYNDGPWEWIINSNTSDVGNCSQGTNITIYLIKHMSHFSISFCSGNKSRLSLRVLEVEMEDQHQMQVKVVGPNMYEVANKV